MVEGEFFAYHGEGAGGEVQGAFDEDDSVAGAAGVVEEGGHGGAYEIVGL